MIFYRKSAFLHVIGTCVHRKTAISFFNQTLSLFKSDLCFVLFCFVICNTHDQEVRSTTYMSETVVVEKTQRQTAEVGKEDMLHQQVFN